MNKEKLLIVLGPGRQDKGDASLAPRFTLSPERSLLPDSARQFDPGEQEAGLVVDVAWIRQSLGGFVGSR